jgi:hypothetical protein
MKNIDGHNQRKRHRDMQTLVNAITVSSKTTQGRVKTWSLNTDGHSMLVKFIWNAGHTLKRMVLPRFDLSTMIIDNRFPH